MKIANLRWFLLGGSLLFWVNFFISTGIAGEQDGSLFVLPQVTVVGTIDPLNDKSALTEKQIKALPKGNGSINELLTVMPSVQAGEMANTSLQGGEITPPNISISGGKVYDNNFMIDGMGVNNLLDPISSSPTASGLFLPGHPQSLFFNSNLIDEIVVYDSNVSAEFSGFTGGVVDAKTISPDSVFGGNVRYRTTRDQWTEFYIDDEDKENFESSNNASMQPRFKKNDVGILFKVPLTENMGILTSYSVLDSNISLIHLGEDKDQSRHREDFFIKYKFDITDRDTLAFTADSQSEKEEYFYLYSYASDYTVERITYDLNMDYQHVFDAGEFELKAGYLQGDRERDAPPHLFFWKVSPSKPWGALVDSSTSREGMVGTLEEGERDFQLKTKFTAETIKTGPIRHAFKIGAGYERVRGWLERDKDSYQYSSPVLDSSVICEDGAIDCITGEQYFTRRIVFQAASVTETIDKYNFFVEDSIRWKRFQLRPGLNISYDDFMKNTDYSPRLAGSYDLLGNNSTVLIAGINRYYGKTLLAYKLREAGKPTLNQKLNTTSGEWETLSYGITNYKYSKLKTPYTDELVIGLDQNIWDGIAKLRYVKRDGDDEFARERDVVAREDGIRYYTLNNNGSTQHEEYSIEWSRSWNNHYFSVNATYQETETSNEDYDIDFDESDLSALCWFDGDTFPCSELPRRDYNRPWVVNLIYSVNLPYGLTFTNHTKYRSGYIGLDSLNRTERETAGVPEEVSLAYQEEKQPESWIFNWQIDWRRNLYRNHGVQLSLEVNNVFNQKVPAGEVETIQTYELGRQFWVGMEYYF